MTDNPPLVPDPVKDELARIAAEQAASQLVLEQSMTKLSKLKPEPPKLPHETRSEPVRAIKTAYLVLHSDGVKFEPLTSFYSVYGTVKDTYGVRGVARCACPHRKSTYEFHRVLTPTSDCGFYGWKPGQLPSTSAGTWLLEVAFSGKVIEHKEAYRAQYQRVLKISPIPHLACTPPFRLVAAYEGGYIRMLCNHCKPVEGHNITAARLRELIDVEIDMDWARGVQRATLRS